MKPPVGSRVMSDGKSGTVTAHRPGSMVDVRWDDKDYDMRTDASALRVVKSNPGPRGGLTDSERDHLPQSAFALSGRRFPINDRRHAVIAMQYILRGFVAEGDAPKVLEAIHRRYPPTDAKNSEIWAFYKKHQNKLSPRMAANPDEIGPASRLLDISYEDSPAYFAAEPFSVGRGAKERTFTGRWVLPSTHGNMVSTRFADAVADHMVNMFKTNKTARLTEHDRQAVFDRVNRETGSHFSSLADFEAQQSRMMDRFEAFMRAYMAAPEALQMQLMQVLRLRKPLRRGIVDVNNNPAGDVYDPAKEQFRAVVQGVYESLIRKELGLPYNAPFESGGRRLDSPLDAETKRQLLSRAYAIATRQGQKYGWLKEGSQEPTDKGRFAAQQRFSDAKHAGENRQDYERTLSAVRKSGQYRVVAEVVDGQTRYVVQPRPPEGSKIPAYRLSEAAAEADAQKAAGFFRENPFYADDRGGWIGTYDLPEEPKETLISDASTYAEVAKALGVEPETVWRYADVERELVERTPSGKVIEKTWERLKPGRIRAQTQQTFKAKKKVRDWDAEDALAIEAIREKYKAYPDLVDDYIRTLTKLLPREDKIRSQFNWMPRVPKMYTEVEVIRGGGLIREDAIEAGDIIDPRLKGHRVSKGALIENLEAAHTIEDMDLPEGAPNRVRNLELRKVKEKARLPAGSTWKDAKQSPAYSALVDTLRGRLEDVPTGQEQYFRYRTLLGTTDAGKTDIGFVVPFPGMKSKEWWAANGAAFKQALGLFIDLLEGRDLPEAAADSFKLAGIAAQPIPWSYVQEEIPAGQARVDYLRKGTASAPGALLGNLVLPEGLNEALFVSPVGLKAMSYAKVFTYAGLIEALKSLQAHSDLSAPAVARLPAPSSPRTLTPVQARTGETLAKRVAEDLEKYAENIALSSPLPASYAALEYETGREVEQLVPRGTPLKRFAKKDDRDAYVAQRKSEIEAAAGERQARMTKSIAAARAKAETLNATFPQELARREQTLATAQAKLKQIEEYQKAATLGRSLAKGQQAKGGGPLYEVQQEVAEARRELIDLYASTGREIPRNLGGAGSVESSQAAQSEREAEFEAERLGELLQERMNLGQRLMQLNEEGNVPTRARPDAPRKGKKAKPKKTGSSADAYEVESQVFRQMSPEELEQAGGPEVASRGPLLVDAEETEEGDVVAPQGDRPMTEADRLVESMRAVDRRGILEFGERYLAHKPNLSRQEVLELLERHRGRSAPAKAPQAERSSAPSTRATAPSGTPAGTLSKDEEIRRKQIATLRDREEDNFRFRTRRESEDLLEKAPRFFDVQPVALLVEFETRSAEDQEEVNKKRIARGGKAEPIIPVGTALYVHILDMEPVDQAAVEAAHSMLGARGYGYPRLSLQTRLSVGAPALLAPFVEPSKDAPSPFQGMAAYADDLSAGESTVVASKLGDASSLKNLGDKLYESPVGRAAIQLSADAYRRGLPLAPEIFKKTFDEVNSPEFSNFTPPRHVALGMSREDVRKWAEKGTSALVPEQKNLLQKFIAKVLDGARKAMMAGKSEAVNFYPDFTGALPQAGAGHARGKSDLVYFPRTTVTQTMTYFKTQREKVEADLKRIDVLLSSAQSDAALAGASELQREASSIGFLARADRGNPTASWDAAQKGINEAAPDRFKSRDAAGSGASGGVFSTSRKSALRSTWVTWSNLISDLYYNLAASASGGETRRKPLLLPDGTDLFDAFIRVGDAEDPSLVEWALSAIKALGGSASKFLTAIPESERAGFLSVLRLADAVLTATFAEAEGRLAVAPSAEGSAVTATGRSESEEIAESKRRDDIAKALARVQNLQPRLPPTTDMPPPAFWDVEWDEYSPTMEAYVIYVNMDQYRFAILEKEMSGAVKVYDRDQRRVVGKVGGDTSGVEAGPTSEMLALIGQQLAAIEEGDNKKSAQVKKQIRELDRMRKSYRGAVGSAPFRSPYRVVGFQNSKSMIARRLAKFMPPRAAGAGMTPAQRQMEALPTAAVDPYALKSESQAPAVSKATAGVNTDARVGWVEDGRWSDMQKKAGKKWGAEKDVERFDFGLTKYAKFKTYNPQVAAATILYWDTPELVTGAFIPLAHGRTLIAPSAWTVSNDPAQAQAEALRILPFNVRQHIADEIDSLAWEAEEASIMGDTEKVKEILDVLYGVDLPGGGRAPGLISEYGRLLSRAGEPLPSRANVRSMGGNKLYGMRLSIEGAPRVSLRGFASDSERGTNLRKGSDTALVRLMKINNMQEIRESMASGQRRSAMHAEAVKYLSNLAATMAMAKRGGDVKALPEEILEQVKKMSPEERARVERRASAAAAAYATLRARGGNIVDPQRVAQFFYASPGSTVRYQAGAPTFARIEGVLVEVSTDGNGNPMWKVQRPSGEVDRINPMRANAEYVFVAPPGTAEAAPASQAKLAEVLVIDPTSGLASMQSKVAAILARSAQEEQAQFREEDAPAVQSPVQRVQVKKKLTLEDVDANPAVLFLMADTMRDTDRPPNNVALFRSRRNVITVPVIKKYAAAASVFLSDEDFPRIRSAIDAAFARLSEHVAKGGMVAVDPDGMPPFWARLDLKAPQIHRYITWLLSSLGEEEAKHKMGPTAPPRASGDSERLSRPGALSVELITQVKPGTMAEAKVRVGPVIHIPTTKLSKEKVEDLFAAVQAAFDELDYRVMSGQIIALPAAGLNTKDLDKKSPKLGALVRLRTVLLKKLAALPVGDTSPLSTLKRTGMSTGGRSPLTTDAAVPIEIDGKKYPTANHAFYAALAQTPEMAEIIRNSSTPEANPNVLFKALDEAGQDALMLNVLRKKFEQNPDLIPLLVATGGTDLKFAFGEQLVELRDEFLDQYLSGQRVAANPLRKKGSAPYAPLSSRANVITNGASRNRTYVSSRHMPLVFE